MKTEKITYQSGDKSFEGFLAQPEGDSNPCVLTVSYTHLTLPTSPKV